MCILAVSVSVVHTPQQQEYTVAHRATLYIVVDVVMNHVQTRSTAVLGSVLHGNTQRIRGSSEGPDHEHAHGLDDGWI